MDINKINELCLKRGITILQLSKKIGMSNSFYTTLKAGSLKVGTLEKIAVALDVPVTAFFNESQETFDKTELEKKIAELEKQLNENQYSIKVVSTLILSMYISYSKYIEKFSASEKEAIIKSDFGKKIENLIQIDWDSVIVDYRSITKMIEGKSVL